VTASVSGIQFVAPILIGDLVSVHARLIYTGHSSMHLLVDVFAGDLRQGQSRLATSCVMVLVALDAPDGKPTAVPAWLPRDADEQRLQAKAQELQALSRGMQRLVDTPDGCSA